MDHIKLDLTVFENFRAIKLGPGALSKPVIVLVAADACMAVLGWHSPSLAPFALAGIAVSPIFYLMAHFATLKSFPVHALLDGAELRDYYVATQGVPSKPMVRATSPIENPQGPNQDSLPTNEK